MKNIIFSYCNFQINSIVAEYKQLVMNKVMEGTDYKYSCLHYHLPDGELYPDDVINYGIKELFEQGFDNILILDIDCIPLSTSALDYIFEQASKGILVGNAQRSHHIENNAHIFIGSSCLCLNKDVFMQLGRPSFHPNLRGDIAEELVYIAEARNMPIEFFAPYDYEASPVGAEKWELDGVMKPYGIGTTFMNKHEEKLFYHLFESRYDLHTDKFINKCKAVLDV